MEELVIFMLNGEKCGASVSQVQEIMKYNKIEKVTDSPDFIIGYILLRGQKVPIIDLNIKFEMGDTEIKSDTKIILRLINGNFVGYIVNNVLDIMIIPEEDIDEPPSTLGNSIKKYIKGVGKVNNDLISILDMRSILDEEEVKLLDDFQLKLKQ